MRVLLVGFFIMAMSFCVYAEEWCGAKECHGLDMSCAMFNTPRACTAIYKLGDFCRQYAKCKMVDGQCQLVKEEIFDSCVVCVDQCTKNAQEEASAVFDCEHKCRAQAELAEEPKIVNAILEEPYQLRLGETAFIQQENLKITFISILEDSRCPEGVRCEWRGIIKIRLRVFKGDDCIGDVDIADENFPHLDISAGTSIAGYSIKFVSFTNDAATLVVLKNEN